MFNTYQVSFLLEGIIGHIDLFVYDRDENIIPNNQHLHGSARHEIRTSGELRDGDYSFFKQEMEITRTMWKSLDRESEKCSHGHNTQDTEICVTRYKEH